MPCDPAAIATDVGWPVGDYQRWCFGISDAGADCFGHTGCPGETWQRRCELKDMGNSAATRILHLFHQSFLLKKPSLVVPKQSRSTQHGWSTSPDKMVQ